MSYFVRGLRIASSLLLVLVLILAFLLVGVRLFGLQVFTVLSGSMEPQYHTGSTIYVKETDPATLREADVITYRLTDSTVATHRIIEVKNEKGTLSFVTKGDANDVADASPVSPAQIIGTPVFTVPYLGYLSVFLQTRSGRFASIGAGLFLLLLIFLPDLLQETKSQ